MSPPGDHRGMLAKGERERNFTCAEIGDLDLNQSATLI
jgi:hypothetical protein